MDNNIRCIACRNDLQLRQDLVKFQVRGPVSSPIVICRPHVYRRARDIVMRYKLGAGEYALCRDVRGCNITQRMNAQEVPEINYG